ncbi:riboflavin synthase [Opitutaceae bacterium TAV5]|nr:riboflavin synthase [Opitutaceae bacterium TAV5]
MSLDAPAPATINAAGFSFGIVAARYNPELVDALVAQVRDQLLAAGAASGDVTVLRVPGSNELPVATQLLLRRQPALDAVIGLGVIIRGDTLHYQLVAEASQQGLHRVSLDAGVPVIVGVVVAENAQQAEDRCRGPVNRGAEFARAALEMAALKRSLSSETSTAASASSTSASR